ncbi:protein of unknown function [Methylocaldum szegediense]|uniref:Uncharacterized protein n=1 Tax=Methylocaldum szegediense TaxID=73780 RepID=A0ABM9I973_9GAMM|nr:protein of unknown function [Methylocaldum szegediense]
MRNSRLNNREWIETNKVLPMSRRAMVTPGLITGSGLKQIQLMMVGLRTQRNSRLNNREWIETNQYLSVP